MIRPRLLIVTGSPAAGKTTLTTKLASELELPVLSKDLVKESLFDSVGAESLAASQRLGRAAYGVVFAVAHELLGSGVSLILEAPFIRGVSDADIEALIDISTAAFVVCTPRPEIVVDRYRRRAINRARYRGHMDQVRPEMVRPPSFEEPDLGVPRLRVDTSDGYQPSLPEIVSWLSETLGIAKCV